jgi:excisionase family DNA binding protein
METHHDAALTEYRVATPGSPPQADGEVLLPLLITVAEAARMLSIGRTSVYQLIWDHQLRPVRIGRNVRFTIAELERFVAERHAEPTTV